MKPYFIWVGNWSDLSGGTAILNVLAERLRRLGTCVYLSSADQNPNFESFPLISSFEGDPKNVIGVYPEVVGGENTFECGTVAHYILNAPGFFGIPFNPKINDLLFVHKGFEHTVNLTKERILNLHFMQLNKCFNTNSERLFTFCYRGKGNQPNHNRLKNIPYIEQFIRQGLDVLADTFNKTKILYCYDNVTALVEFARLCGCPVVVIPDDLYGESHAKESITWHLGGIGYGFKEEDYAINSIFSDKLLNFYTNDWENIIVKDVERFFEITQEGK